jgi:predicted PurR-regulated permease PerM
MNLKDIHFWPFIKLMAIATLVVLFFNQTGLWMTAKSAIEPILSAFIIAYVLDYAVRFFETHFRLPRPIGILVTFVIFIIALTLIGLVLIPSIFDAVSSLFTVISNMDVDFQSLYAVDLNNIYLNEIQKAVLDAVAPILEKLTNATGAAVFTIMSEFQKFTSRFIGFIVSLVISIYMLAEKKDLTARIKRTIRAFSSDRTAQTLFYVGKMAHRIFKDFVLGKLIDSLIIGFITFVTLKLFHFKFGLLIALIVGVTNMIPYFGPFIGAVPAALITFIATPSLPVNVAWILLIILIIQQIDGWIIGPFVLGDSVGVSAFWIIVAVTIGGATFGVAGMFLGVPLAVLLKTLVEEEVDRRLNAKGYDDIDKKDMRIKKNKSQQVQNTAKVTEQNSNQEIK